jgi:hypothetical protein
MAQRGNHHWASHQNETEQSARGRIARVKRFGRIAWDMLAALSALFCVATILLWRESYHLRHGIQFQQIKDAWGVDINCGRVTLFHDFYIGMAENVPGIVHTTGIAEPDRNDNASDSDITYLYWNYDGFGRLLRDGGPGCSHEYWCPAAFLVFLSAAPVLAWALIRRTKPGPGLCPICNYDLRATPDRCPECGAVPDSR